MLYPQLEACLFALRAGEIGPVVETPLGFHLLFCEEIHPAGHLSLQEVLPHLRELRARQYERHQRAWLAGLLQSAPTSPESLPD